MNIQLFYNSSCQSSRGYELLFEMPWSKQFISKVCIPDEDLLLTYTEFSKKYGTEKFPFIVDSGVIITFDNLPEYIHNEFKNKIMHIQN